MDDMIPARLADMAETRVENGIGAEMRRAADCGGLQAQASADGTGEFAALRARAEAAEAAQAMFMANLGRQVRAPLHALRGLTAALADHPQADAQDEMLALLDNVGTALARAFDEFLDVTLIETGQLRIEPSPFRPAHLAQHVENRYRPGAEARGLSLALHVIGEEWYHADDRRLRQVLDTLVGNAINYTEFGEVEVQITAQHAASRLQIRVRDSGRGIAPEMIAQIFDIHQDTRRETMRLHGSAGLGLPIAQAICRRMGGDLTVKSCPGVGSTFTAWVPVTEMADAPRFDLTDVEGQLAALQADRPLKLLVVECGPDQHAVMRAMLDSWDIEADLVECGLEAVELIRRADHDLILLNLHMPVMQGPQAVATIRHIEAEADLPHRPIIGLDSVGADANAADDVLDLRLSKPFSRHDLAAALVKVLGARLV